MKARFSEGCSWVVHGKLVLNSKMLGDGKLRPLALPHTPVRTCTQGLACDM